MAQVGARAINVFVGLALGLALVRGLEADGFGDYVLVTTVVTLFGLLAEFGLATVSLREVAQKPDDRDAVLGSATAMRCVGGVVATVGVQVLLALIGASPTVRWAALIASAVFLTDALLSVFIVFQVQLHHHVEAFVRIAIDLLKLVGVLVLVAVGASLVAIVAAPVVAAALGGLVALWLARRRYHVRMRVDRATTSRLLRESLPQAMVGIAGILFLKLDALMVGFLRPSADLGVYGAAYTPIESLLLTAAVLIAVIFPLAARAWTGPRETMGAVYHVGVESLVVLFAVPAVSLIFIGDELVATAYGTGYEDAVLPMQLLAVALVFVVLNMWQGGILLAAGRQWVTFGYIVAAVVFNVAIDIPLILKWGPTGAAIGTLTAAGLLVVCSTIAVARVIDDPIRVHAGARIVLAVLLLVLGLMIGDRVSHANVAVTLAVGAAFYIGALAALRVNPLGRLVHLDAGASDDAVIDLPALEKL
jgi:O-antigen/teichoic acid export membrane protein